MTRSRAVAAALAAASFSIFIPDAFGTTVFSTSFETSGASYTVGSNIKGANGWVNGGGSGTAVVQSDSGLARTGSNYVLLAAPASTSGNWCERDLNWSGANLAESPVITYGMGGRLFSPASGTANRTVS